MSGIVLLGCGHAHLSALRAWRGASPPVVVTRSAVEAYSGRVPGVLRREAGRADMLLARAVAAAGGRLVIGTCVAIDLAGRTLLLDNGGRVPFRLLSLDLGAATAAPAGAISARPAASLAEAVARLEAGPPGRVLVVGAGAAGTELAIALARRWAGQRRVGLVAIAEPLPDAPPPIRRRATQALANAGVAVIRAEASHLLPDRLVTADGARHEAVAVVWAAGLLASTLPLEAGLRCGAGGFVLVDAGLRSVSHPFVFAAGDGAAFTPGLPKSGAFAVAAGRVLAANLRRAEAGLVTGPWRPPATALAIIGIGDRRGLAWRGGWWLAGRPAWWLKAWLDAEWMRRLN